MCVGSVSSPALSSGVCGGMWSHSCSVRSVLLPCREVLCLARPMRASPPCRASAWGGQVRSGPSSCAVWGLTGRRAPLCHPCCSTRKVACCGGLAANLSLAEGCCAWCSAAAEYQPFLFGTLLSCRLSGVCDYEACGQKRLKPV